MPTIEERRRTICDQFKAIMNIWDTQVQNPHADMKELAFLRLKIDGFIRALNQLEEEEKNGKAA